MPANCSVERRKHKRLDLRALVLTGFGTYYTRDISTGGVSIIGPPELKEKLRLNETIEFNIRVLHGDLLIRSVDVHCRGEVIRINGKSPYVTEAAIKLDELAVLAVIG
ncbi:MAG: PilZ domain-containing protein [Candidatus Brocadiales bacterium]